MPIGRPPKPAHLKLVTGNPGKRKLKAEPHTEPLGDPPATLRPELRSVWVELVTAAPQGVLRQSDSMLVELAAALLTQVRAGDNRIGLVTELRQCLGEIGMSPSSRARLAVAPPPAKNPFDE